MSEKKDLRRHSRISQATPVELSWTDRHGAPHSEKARCVDVSESGMRIEASISIDKGTYVTVRANSLSLHGSASVRSSARKGSKYVLGLHFTGGMKWSGKTP